ncbi:MFS inorganic phosphate transporter [Mycena sanguinolenta]|uniref:MFS inorganic phosphate transporter n=1 Tax=Mycena sanguinolenta TaxID=230812 RepID=A0A8H6YF30_9AGAR|nr:MFS inorganic phosphate transporter [Mycena sanguinolenta]
MTSKCSNLANIEGDNRPPYHLTYTEVKLLGIAGAHLFNVHHMLLNDTLRCIAYDLFVINPVATMLQYRLYGGHALPRGPSGLYEGRGKHRKCYWTISVRCVMYFEESVTTTSGPGYLADALGRKAIYGKELMLIIGATILCLTTPTGTLSPDSCLIYLGVFRIILGIGVGGDYPMSASITSDRAAIRKRGTMLAYIFSNQRWGSLVGSLVTIVVLAAYKHVMNDEGKTSKVDGVWRIVVGVSLIPAFGTLYQRLTLPESDRFKESQGQGQEVNDIQLQHDDNWAAEVAAEKSGQHDAYVVEVVHKEAHFQGSVLRSSASDTLVISDSEFLHYFSEWRHMKLLIGTCMCWFLLDIAFYGINLNQNVVLEQIGFDGKTGTPWEKLFKVSTGNIIITALGFVPGYWATVLLIEKLGRKWIQIQGFLLAALFLAILAGTFTSLSKPAFIVCFSLLQFFFNFGANTTTYCYPAEVFPTRFKGFAHGLSGAAGKAGAIISALAFNSLSESIGTAKVLWSVLRGMLYRRRRLYASSAGGSWARSGSGLGLGDGGGGTVKGFPPVVLILCFTVI